MRPYDYARRVGVELISWERFEALVRQLALQIEAYEPQIVLGIARGGLFPATMLSCLLRRELYPIRLTRRLNDAVVRQQPTWLVRPPDKVQGRRVLIVDEIADSGQTLAMAADEVRHRGPSEVRTAVLSAHTWAKPRPNYVGFTSDALILNPWDREVLIDGQFVTHPELAAALHELNIPSSDVQ
jgi:hypoxanthine phosphoribosyltransferase